MLLTIVLSVFVLALVVFVLGYMASGVGALAGIVVYVLPVLFKRSPKQPGVQSWAAGGAARSATREEIMGRPIPGTYAWDLMIEAERAKAAHGRRSKRRK